ncbi:MAG TPA: 4-demethylwyosine synthase TYW1 [Candidatus Poseidoniales archaeon]|nr:MAG: 4-demethylwyosine synthase TYW1 [Euryarchaeota archaeon]HIA39567.1 4-demethylwyosine synthase TYW1 [Candidatus Poseidoniales archaeon]PXY74793.1 MAG: 4-demethylwyosine synthase TYW1 [Euryarchaeota archaeon]PXY76946.1 MAG: 4-demethylwyosine synthase TYW1 [Euryarchaeota archaeon]HIA90545.1 4-demethylwyosine synthase TYW1 [Candidatus Poseidoniales archaeon]
MDPQLKAKLQKQRYHLVGEHGGVKICHWTKESLLRDRSCYKGKFYGIASHECLQMSPVVDQCNLACTYCWREPHMDSLELTDQDPLELLYESVRAQRRLLTGYGGNIAASPEKFIEAQNPKHVAISLNGEPTLYQNLSEYIDLCHQHGMTTMLVTNGTLPKAIENLDVLPTQLYVSVDAPNEEVFNRICKPKWGSAAWQKFEQTIDLLPSLDTRIVCRHTLVKGENMNPEHLAQYAALDNRADPDWIECKGYVFVGHSREVMSLENMPSHDDVLEFANTLAPLVDRRLLDDSRPSRVALVGREKIPLPIPEKIMDFPEDLGIAPPIKHLTLAKATEN